MSHMITKTELDAFEFGRLCGIAQAYAVINRRAEEFGDTVTAQAMRHIFLEVAKEVYDQRDDTLMTDGARDMAQRYADGE